MSNPPDPISLGARKPGSVGYDKAEPPTLEELGYATMSEPIPTPRTDKAQHDAWNGPFDGEPETQAWRLARDLERETIRLRAEKANLARLLSIRCSPRVRHDDGCICVYCECLTAIAAADQPER